LSKKKTPESNEGSESSLVPEQLSHQVESVSNSPTEILNDALFHNSQELICARDEDSEIPLRHPVPTSNIAANNIDTTAKSSAITLSKAELRHKEIVRKMKLGLVDPSRDVSAMTRGRPSSHEAEANIGSINAAAAAKKRKTAAGTSGGPGGTGGGTAAEDVETRKFNNLRKLRLERIRNMIYNLEANSMDSDSEKLFHFEKISLNATNDKLIFRGKLNGHDYEAFCFIEFSPTDLIKEDEESVGGYLSHKHIKQDGSLAIGILGEHHAVVHSDSDDFKAIVVETLKLLI